MKNDFKKIRWHEILKKIRVDSVEQHQKSDYDIKKLIMMQKLESRIAGLKPTNPIKPNRACATGYMQAYYRFRCPATYQFRVR